MEPFEYFFIGFGIFVVFVMLIPGRWLWSKFVALSQIRPDESILFTEDRVWITYQVTKVTMSAGGISSGWRRSKVTITDQRILEHRGARFFARGADIPLGIVNYKKKESKPGYLRLFDPTYFMNVETDKRAFGIDSSGREYLEVSDGEFGIRKRFFFQNIEAVKAIFAEAS